jgi:hypothetical protein
VKGLDGVQWRRGDVLVIAHANREADVVVPFSQMILIIWNSFCGTPKGISLPGLNGRYRTRSVTLRTHGATGSSRATRLPLTGCCSPPIPDDLGLAGEAGPGGASAARLSFGRRPCPHTRAYRAGRACRVPSPGSVHTGWMPASLAGAKSMLNQLVLSCENPAVSTASGWSAAETGRLAGRVERRRPPTIADTSPRWRRPVDRHAFAVSIDERVAVAAARNSACRHP